MPCKYQIILDPDIGWFATPVNKDLRKQWKLHSSVENPVPY